MTRREAGVYRVVVSDSRGEDESVMELLDDGENDDDEFIVDY